MSGIQRRDCHLKKAYPMSGLPRDFHQILCYITHRTTLTRGRTRTILKIQMIAVQSGIRPMPQTKHLSRTTPRDNPEAVVVATLRPRSHNNWTLAASKRSRQPTTPRTQTETRLRIARATLTIIRSLTLPSKKPRTHTDMKAR